MRNLIEKHAQATVEQALHERARDVQNFSPDYKLPAEVAGHFSIANPVTMQIKDRQVRSAVESAKRRFKTDFEALDILKGAADKSRFGLVDLMATEYPTFLKQNRLPDKPQSFNAFYLAVLSDYVKSAQPRVETAGSIRYLRQAALHPVSRTAEILAKTGFRLADGLEQVSPHANGNHFPAEVNADLVYSLLLYRNREGKQMMADFLSQNPEAEQKIKALQALLERFKVTS